jgi:hypothetical protein
MIFAELIDFQKKDTSDNSTENLFKMKFEFELSEEKGGFWLLI